MILYVTLSFLNVFLHIMKLLLVVNASKMVASINNCICYTFSAIIVKFISETNLTTAIIVAATTNFAGCYAGMWLFEKIKRK